MIHNAPFERRILGEHGITIQNVFDTLKTSRTLFGKSASGGHGLSAVCKRELGITIDKSEQTSNWAQRPLNESQLSYAAIDAEVLIDLYDTLERQGQRQLPFGD